MIGHSLRRSMAVLLVAAMLVLGLAVTVHAAEETTFSGSMDQIEAGCADSGGAWIESPDGTYGICVYEGGLSVGCDDISVEGEDNCWIMQERKVPKETRQEFNEIKDAVGPLELAGKPPKGIGVLVDALEIVAQPGYCDKKLSRRTQKVLEALTIALLEGDRGRQTCGSSDQLSPAPPRGDGGGGSPSTSSSTTSTTSPPDTTSTSSGDGQLT